MPIDPMLVLAGISGAGKAVGEISDRRAKERERADELELRRQERDLRERELRMRQAVEQLALVGTLEDRGYRIRTPGDVDAAADRTLRALPASTTPAYPPIDVPVPRAATLPQNAPVDLRALRDRARSLGITLPPPRAAAAYNPADAFAALVPSPGGPRATARTPKVPGESLTDRAMRQLMQIDVARTFVPPTSRVAQRFPEPSFSDALQPETITDVYGQQREFIRDPSISKGAREEAARRRAAEETRQAARQALVEKARGDYETLQAIDPTNALVRAGFNEKSPANFAAALDDLQQRRAIAATNDRGEDRTLVPVQQDDGSIVYVPRSQAVGKRPPARSTGSGNATIRQAVASNNQQLGLIDDALSELEAYPQGVGLTRGMDAADQRIDPQGIAVRAAIANIGSMIIHDRSGAAVTAAESPRLKPFIPSVRDTAAAIRIKLTKLRAALVDMNAGLETDAAVEPSAPRGGSSGGRGGGRGGGGPQTGDIVLPGGPGQAPLSASDREKAASDPAFAAWLRNRGYQVP
jgi:hypothetical protein